MGMFTHDIHFVKRYEPTIENVERILEFIDRHPNAIAEAAWAGVKDDVKFVSIEEMLEMVKERRRWVSIDITVAPDIEECIDEPPEDDEEIVEEEETEDEDYPCLGIDLEISDKTNQLSLHTDYDLCEMQKH